LVEARLADALGNPQTCPHGNPIPGTGAPSLPGGAITLDQAQAEQELVVVRITEEGERDLELLVYLEEHSIVPGERLAVKEVADWNEIVILHTSSGEASLGFKAARTIWAGPAN
jgi:DtxR family Mn-dependent transcriptional regulator